MKKNYLMAMALASMVVGGASCTKEVLETPDSAVVKGQTGKVVFRLDTGGSASFTRATLSEAETKITSLSVHLFKADGTPLTGYKQDYTGADISDNKLNVTIPTSLMGEKDVKAYLVANVPVGGSGNTETALKDFVSTIQAGDLSGGVIPMASPPVNLDLSSPVAEVSVSMKRAMSVILVKVGEGADFTAAEFTYKLKDVRTDKGYLFKDMVVEGSISDLSLTPKSDGLLAYIYQSPAFTIEVAPQNGTSLASAGTRVVQVQANSAMKRNKKYVLTLLPKKAKESDPSSTATGFTIKFEEWDSTDTFDVEWDTRVTLKKNLSANLYEVEGNNLRLLPEGAIGSAGTTDYGTPKSWLETLGDVEITKVTMPSLLEESGAGIPAPTDGASFQANWESDTPNLNDITGTLIVATTKDKQESESEFDVTLEGQYITWKKSVSTKYGEIPALQSDAKGRAMDLVQLYRYTEPSIKYNLVDIFTLAEGWKIQDIRAKKPVEGRGKDFQLLISPADGLDMNGQTIKVTLNTEKDAVTFRCGSKVRGYADIIVTIKKGEVTKERYLRVTNRWDFK